MWNAEQFGRISRKSHWSEPVWTLSSSLHVEHTLAASSLAPMIKSKRPSPFQSTIAGRPCPTGMPWNGLGSTSIKCLPDLNSKSESPSDFFKITSKSPSWSQSTTMGSSVKKVLISSKTKKGFVSARTKCLACPRQPWRSLVSHHQRNAGNGNTWRRPNHFMAVRLPCAWDSRSRNCLVSGFSGILCFVHSRQCAVPAYNILKHQEIKQSFEVWCMLLFKLKAIEAKCHTAGYRECASQQIPTQVLLHNKKIEQTWNTSPRDDDILGPNVCPRWFLLVTEQIKSQFELVAVVAHSEQQTELIFVAAMDIFITLLLYCFSDELAPLTASAIQFITSQAALGWLFWACQGLKKEVIRHHKTTAHLLQTSSIKIVKSQRLWTFTRW